jgi:hypothetical protein
MHDMLGDGAQEEAGQLMVATSADHERSGSLAQTNECRPWEVQDRLALDDDGRIELLGPAKSIRNDGLGRFMQEARSHDEGPCRGQLLVGTHQVEQGVPSGRLLHRELEGTATTFRAIDAHNDSGFAYGLVRRVIGSHGRLLRGSGLLPVSSYAARPA